MKNAFIFLLFFSSFGSAQAENTFELNLQAGFESNMNDLEPPFPVSTISKSGLTFSGDVFFESTETGVCCLLTLGNDGSFTVGFDNPVNSAALDIFIIPDENPDYGLLAITESTVSASYTDGQGNFVGQSSVTAGWIPPTSANDNWQWDNTFNGRSNTFGVSNTSGFSEITFSVAGGSVIYGFRGVFSLPAELGTSTLFYNYVNPIPEPHTYALMLAGLGLVGIFARRRVRKNQCLN